MEPFIVKPGETIKGLGRDFATRLAPGETVASVVAACDSTGITVAATGMSGATAFADLVIADSLTDTTRTLSLTVTGTVGSIRKGSRLIWVRVDSE